MTDPGGQPVAARSARPGRGAKPRSTGASPPGDVKALRTQSAERLRELLALVAESQAELANLDLQRQQLLKVFEAIESHPVASAPGPDGIRRAAEEHLAEIESKVQAEHDVLDAVLEEEAEVRGMLEALLDIQDDATDPPMSRNGLPMRPADRRRAEADAERQAVGRAILATLVVEPGLTGLQVADALAKSGAAAPNSVIPMIATLHQRGLLRRGGHKQWFVSDDDGDE